jgi:hypothetical protein
VTVADDIAQRMREEPLSVIDHLAEAIQLCHEPPSPADGTVDGAFLAQAMRATAADTSTVRTVLSLEAVGDQIIQRSVLTAANGSRPATTHTAIYGVVDGQIMSLESRYETAPPTQ